MDILCKAVKEKECLDFENEECKDIAKAVDLLLHKFIDYMHEDYQNLRVSQFFCGGSMVEKTRLLRSHFVRGSRSYLTAPCIEFDYLAVIEKWPGIDIERVKRSTGRTGFTGCMTIEREVVGNPHPDNKGYLDVDCSDKMIKDMIACVNKRCTCTSEDGVPYFSYRSGCTACTVKVATGSLTFEHENMMFQWKPKVPKTDDNNTSFGKDLKHTESNTCSLLHNHMVDYDRVGHLRVKVDFHIAFELLGNPDGIMQFSDGQTPTVLPSDSTRALYLFPKGTKHCDQYRSGSFWKISTIAHELAMIKSTTSEHRYAYMTLKFLTVTLITCTELSISITNNRASPCSFVEPYMLKTIFLHHIDKCDKPGRDMKECVSEMMTDLKQLYQTGVLAHFHLKYNLDPGFTKNIETQCYVHQLQLSFLTCLNSILCMPSAHSNMDDIAMDMISLHCIRKSYQSKQVEKFNHKQKSRFDEFLSARQTRTAEEVLKKTACEYYLSAGSESLPGIMHYRLDDDVPLKQRIKEYINREKERQLERNEDRKRCRVEDERVIEAGREREEGKKMKTEENSVLYM